MYVNWEGKPRHLDQDGVWGSRVQQAGYTTAITLLAVLSDFSDGVGFVDRLLAGNFQILHYAAMALFFGIIGTGVIL